MVGVLVKASSLWVFSPGRQNFDKLTPSFVRMKRQTVFHCRFGAIDGSLCRIISECPIARLTRLFTGTGTGLDGLTL